MVVRALVLAADLTDRIAFLRRHCQPTDQLERDQCLSLRQQCVSDFLRDAFRDANGVGNAARRSSGNRDGYSQMRSPSQPLGSARSYIYIRSIYLTSRMSVAGFRSISSASVLHTAIDRARDAGKRSAINRGGQKS